MSQEKKAKLAPGIKKVLDKYGVKGTISVNNHSTLVVTLREGPFEFSETHSINPYWIRDHYEGKTADFLLELKAAMNQSEDGTVANHDNSDIYTDYFDVGWYINIDIGKWDKPYTVKVAKKKHPRKISAIPAPKSNTQIGQAVELYQKYVVGTGVSRQAMITILIDELGIETGDNHKNRVKAAGIYQNAKKRVEG